jgi:hypothetical protein
MVPMDPLGDNERFAHWSGHVRHWGTQDAKCRSWFGGKVIEGLCQVLDEHLQAPQPPRSQAATAALGCVPWLDNDDVIDRLCQLEALCVVVDKGSRPPSRLVREARPFPNVLPALGDIAPPIQGQSIVLGPFSALPEYSVGPVRVLGWRGSQSGKPLLHAKLLVLGHLRWVQYMPDGAPQFEEFEFVPRSVWWGSANWTQAAQKHLEVGTWSDDEDLAREAAYFVGDVIAFSEALCSPARGPRPDLVRIEYDEAAMAEAVQLYYDDDDGGEDDYGPE